MTFNAAGGAHLKALLPATDRAEGNSRFETTFWLSMSLGPPAGGVLMGWLGATVTLLVDAVSFLLSATWIRRIRRPEPEPTPPPGPAPRRGRSAELTAAGGTSSATPGSGRCSGTHCCSAARSCSRDH